MFNFGFLCKKTIVISGIVITFCSVAAAPRIRDFLLTFGHFISPSRFLRFHLGNEI